MTIEELIAIIDESESWETTSYSGKGESIRHYAHYLEFKKDNEILRKTEESIVIFKNGDLKYITNSGVSIIVPISELSCSGWKPMDAFVYIGEISEEDYKKQAKEAKKDLVANVFGKECGFMFCKR